ncbi:hypothetical protein PanWU01x14_270000 [Parasponia andersonii]|uniref:Reverse transcriptase/retrotransposon-derived protein RNase H-like domain-containing protein n=1 Tax=Parasponia andersonii TaxID=3476 RepID=A0A2P5B5K1_PARAD|nr:hypothetical protein PanWU01x14_270000 [Parasponia andersonii]
MQSPRKPKDVQNLAGKVAALSQFVSRSTDKCQPFFEVLKGSKRFEWTEKYEQAFQKLKKYLGSPPLLSKPNPGEELCLYLTVSKYATSAALIREEGNIQRPMYYVSKRLLDAETRYPEILKSSEHFVLILLKGLLVPTSLPFIGKLLKPD